MLIFQNLFQLLAKAVLVSAFTSVRICRYAKNRNGQKCFSWILLSYISDAVIFFQSVLALPFSFPNNIITLRCCTSSLNVGKKEWEGKEGKSSSLTVQQYMKRPNSAATSRNWLLLASKQLKSHEVTSFFFFFPSSSLPSQPPSCH